MSFPEPTERHSGRSFMLSFVLLAAGIVATGYLYCRKSELHYRAEVELQLAAIADLKVGGLVQWRKERLEDGSVFFRNASFAALVQRFFEKPDDADTQHQLQDWLAQYPARNQYDQVRLLDAQGATRLSVPGGLKPANPQIVRGAAEVLRSGQIALQDFYRHEYDRRIYLAVLVPILGGPEGSLPLGVLALRIDPEAYLYPFIERWPTPSLTAETLLVRREGNEVVFLNELRFQTNTALNSRVPLDRVTRPAVQAVLGREGVMDGIDYRGVPVVAARRTIPDSPWFMVARMDAAEVYAPLRARLRWMAVLVGLLLLGAGTVLGLLWRQQRFRFYQERAAVETSLRESEEQFRTLTAAAQDAIVLMDDDGKIVFWNPAAERLFGYASSEVIGRDLHALLAPARYLPAHQPAFLKWRETGQGAAVGKTVELAARRKDGSEFVMELSLSATQTKNGRLAIGVIRDVTERKRAEEEREEMLLQQQGISRIQQSLLAPAPLEEKLKLITDSTVRLFAADFCRVWLIRPGDLCERGCVHAPVQEGPHACRNRDRCLHLLASSGRYTHIDGTAHRRVPFGAYKIGHIASGEDHKFLSNDVTNDPGVHNHEWARELGLVSFAGYQLRIPGAEPLGVLALFAKHPIPPAEDALLDALSSALAQAVQQTQAEETLRRSETKFRTLYNSSGDAVMLLNEKGFFDCNPATLTMFGCATLEEFCAKHPADVSPPVQPDGTDSLTLAGRCIATAMEKGQHCFEWMHRRADTGEPFPADVLLNAMQLDGKPVLQAVVRDVTARKQAEAELARARDAALEGGRLKAAFLANMSHEIRTPMNGVIGMTSLLLDSALTPQQRHFANTIRSSGESLLTIIDDILDFSKIEAGKLTFELLDFDLQEVLETALELVAERAGSKKLELAGLVPPEVPTLLRGDPGRLRQVLLNLLGNAVKFTERGEVILRVARVSENNRRVTLRFEVKDTGLGIPADGQARLFQAFSQVDGSTTRKYGGTGLGLAISKQLVEMMGGKMGVDSAPGAGSTFWFTVPLDQQPTRAQPLPRGKAELANVRVLIVDDNATNREILEHHTRAWKMQSASAASAAEALRMLRAAPPGTYSLAIVDMQMPDMNGLELARAIQADPALSGTRLVMLTSLGEKLEPAALAAAGIAEYLTKPVKQSLLFDCLAAALGHAPPVEVRRIAHSTPPPTPARKLRILLAEDSPINQQVAIGQLAKLGYTADSVANGLEVLEALQRIPYEVIVMDCQMPEMDGYEATREIRRRERQQPTGRPPVHVIAMTAHAMQGDREECLAAGMNDYLSKPVREADLRLALDRCGRSADDGRQAVPPLSPQSLAAAPATPPGTASSGGEPPAPSAGLEQPVIDLVQLREIGNNDPGKMRELADLYLEQAEETRRRLDAAIKAGAANEVHRLAHRWAGASATCGATRILPPLRQLELQTKHGQLDGALQLFEQVSREFASVHRWLTVRLPGVSEAPRQNHPPPHHGNYADQSPPH